jgi:hypothetical protein
MTADPDRDMEVSFLFSQFGGNDTYCSASQIKFMRKSYGPRLNVFTPIHALSSLSKTNWEDRAVIPGKKDDMAIAGGQILGDEHSKHVFFATILLPR